MGMSPKSAPWGSKNQNVGGTQPRIPNEAKYYWIYFAKEVVQSLKKQYSIHVNEYVYK